VSKPKPPPRPPHATSTTRGRPSAGWRLWLPLAVAVGLGVVAVVWFTGRPAGESGQPAGGVLAVGEIAPPVRLPSTTGQTEDVASFRGKRNVLLYFYEHAG
jgi:hypothetical protein